MAKAVNLGNYPAAPQITFTGPMTNPAITNLRSGEVISFTGTVPTGRQWFINVGANR